MGIDFVAGKNTLELDDQILLDDTLEEFAGEVDLVFNDSEGGIFARVQSVLESYVEDNSTIDTATDA